MVHVQTQRNSPQDNSSRWVTTFHGVAMTDEGKAAKVYAVRDRAEKRFSDEHISQAKAAVQRLLERPTEERELGFATLTPRHLTLCMWNQPERKQDASSQFQPTLYKYTRPEGAFILTLPAQHVCPEELMEVQIFEYAMFREFRRARGRRSHLSYLEAGYRSE